MPITELHHPSHHRSWIEVDLAAIAHNVARFCELIGGRGLVMPAIKADAYGLGAVQVAPAALAGGAARLAVATCMEGEELRAAGITAPIQILGASLPEEVERLVANDLIPSIHDLDLARLVSLEAVKQEKLVPVHLKIDTGMGRLGVLPHETVHAAAVIHDLPNIEIEGLFMHFAEPADEAYSLQQLKRFNEGRHLLEESGVRVPLRHAASSAAALLYPESRFDMIRPGAGTYGFLSPTWLQEKINLRPALAWRCVVVQLKDYPPGSSLGYNRTFTTRRPTRVAVLPVGYADGYLRKFSNRAHVLIHGRRAPVVGMISMDYTMVDVTEFPDIAVGTEVTLIGQDGDHKVTLEELADYADTIPYAITTGLGGRPGRCYLNRDKLQT